MNSTQTAKAKPLALITGASSGIGRSLALEFAKHNVGVVLVGRDAKALQKVAEDARGLGAPTAIPLVKDLSGAQGAHEIHKELAAQNLEVDILVNNAGFGVHGYFAETSLQQELELVHVQIDVLLILTKLFLPAMIKRGQGRILNISSVYAVSPVPYQSVYGAVKAFMLAFSESLAYEVRDAGITITVVCPGTTQSNFRTRFGKESRNTGMTADRVAEESYRAMIRGQFFLVPGFFNRFFTTAMGFLPYFLRSFVIQNINARRGMVPPRR